MKPRSLRLPVGLLPALLFTLRALADVVPAVPFQDHAVLQRDQPLPVWGTAAPGEQVTVTFGASSASTTAGADGHWRVTLPPQRVAANPADLVIAGRNTVRLADIVVGEVWLASGQSNMQWNVARAANAPAEIIAGNYPLIRELAVKRTTAATPQERVEAKWSVCAPSTVAEFSAVGYFFARNLHQTLGVPVGILHSSWGGTPVEAWMSEATLASDPAFRVVGERWQQALQEYPGKKEVYDKLLAEWLQAKDLAGQAGASTQVDFLSVNRPPSLPNGLGLPYQPSCLYNGMIAPLAPYAMRGAIWYQGESNAGRAAEYRALFSAMINGWRKDWQSTFAFYFVQLAPFEAGPANTWPFLREAQEQTLALPATGMAVILDIGDPRDIHPSNKQDVGLRLALIARQHLYGRPCAWSGPVFKAAVRDGKAMRVTFDQVGDGLVLRDVPGSNFEVAGADHAFVPAVARIDGKTLVVSARGVPEPVAVRYAWTNSPEGSLFNQAGLPASSFRSDNW